MDPKDLVGIEDLSAEEIVHRPRHRRGIQDGRHPRVKKVPALRGKTLVNLFVEASTRTRMIFRTGGYP